MEKIKLDWDSISYAIAKNRIKVILQNRDMKIEYVDLFSSASGDGYHVYVYTKNEIKNRFFYRRLWKDDGKRIVTDLLKPSGSPQDVLFQLKNLSGRNYKINFLDRFIP